jgi:hypothetical protein
LALPGLWIPSGKGTGTFLPDEMSAKYTFSAGINKGGLYAGKDFCSPHRNTFRIGMKVV